LTYNGKWWDTGSYSATTRVQRFQVLQDPDNPIVVPYGRTPQFTLSALRQDIGGFDFGSAAEFVDFSHPTQVNGKRSTFYPSLSCRSSRRVPSSRRRSACTTRTIRFMRFPRKSISDPTRQHHRFDHPRPPGIPNAISRTLPIFSLDSGLIYERETNASGKRSYRRSSRVFTM